MNAGKVIVLHGMPSVQKKTLRERLSTILDAPNFQLCIDQYITGEPVHLGGAAWQHESAVASSIGQMHNTMAALAKAGNHVIVDHMLVDVQWQRECANLLAELPAYLIGVHDTCDPSQFQAQPHLAMLHTPGVYDLEVDIALHTPAECAVLIQKRLNEGPPPMALRWLKVWANPAKHPGWLKSCATMHAPVVEISNSQSLMLT